MLKCPNCGFHENDSNNSKKFISVFASGHPFRTSNKNMCGLYSCPYCFTAIMSEDEEILDKRKEEYKKSFK